MEGVAGKEVESHEIQGDDCSFVWDETTQLYFHPGTGFYHDPCAGWYYSSKDGRYYKFENGSYVLLESTKVNEHESHTFTGAALEPGNPAQDDSFTGAAPEPGNPAQDEPSAQVYCNRDQNVSSLPADQYGAYPYDGTDESIIGYTKRSSDQAAENPPPPSEWLEETLINLYLSGYKLAHGDVDTSTSLEVGDEDNFSFSANGASCDTTQMVEDGDWISEQHCSLTGQCESILNEDASKDEEIWQSQYGQVVHSGEQPVQDFRVVDLWNWAMVKGSKKDGKDQAPRLVGRLVKQSSKLHPSMPSRGVYRTAPICEAHLDLVRVRTGQVYKLRSPSARYLASLLSYDSSNPTRDWGFPELSVNIQDFPLTKSSGGSEPKLIDEDMNCKGVDMPPNQHSTSKKPRIHEYRDRAAERRNLHGGFGVGPGQKISLINDVGGSTSHVPTSTEEAAAEALNMSFGACSYGRKILENMGWKEGEALGNTRKGLVKPIEAVGNIGNAGVGWPLDRMTK